MEGYFAPDELRLSDLIAMTSRVAANLRFDPRRTPGEAEGRDAGSGEANWSDLYSGHPTLVLAEIASVRVGVERARLGRFRELRELDGFVNHLAEQFLHWHAVLSRSSEPVTRAFWGKLDAAKRQMADLWGEGASSGSPPTWRPFPQARGTAPRVVRGRDVPGPEVPRFLAEAADRILGVIAHLQPESRQALDEQLRAPRHEPALGLSLAFLRLYAKIQGRLNEFTRRRLEFYYLDVLRFESLGRVPDGAFLALAPAPGRTELMVPKGTEFSAGRDQSNTDIVFVSDRDLRVTDARVESVRSLYFDRDDLVSPERELRFVTGIRAHRADVGPDDLDTTGRVPLFGSSAEGRVSAKAPASLGFAVASPTLHLAEGTRTVQFDIVLARGSRAPDETEAADTASTVGGRERLFRELGELFIHELMSADPISPAEARRHREVLDEVIRELGEESGAAGVLRDLFQRDRRAVFHDLFRRSLVVSFTSDSGWREVHNPFVGPLESGMGLRVIVELGPETGPVVPFDPGLHGEGYATRLPVMRFRISADAPFYPYSLLRALELSRIEIQARVRGVTDLVAYNKVGALDPSRPFQPFGPLPDRDSMLAVGSYHAAKKRLREASLDIEWGGLPAAPGGWRTHYFGYDDDYSHDPFQVEISVGRDREWHPLDPTRRARAPLFTSGAEDRLLKRHKVTLDVLDHFEPLSSSVSEEEFRKDPRGRNGMFRLSLEASRLDFGHRAYASVLTRSAQANARRKRPEAPPEPPYTPSIDRLTLNYVARSTITFGAESLSADPSRERFFHDHAFGSFDVTGAPPDERFPLMPGGPEVSVAADGDRARFVRHDGYLFIGLSASRPAGRLSLLVNMVRSATLDASSVGGVGWYYLASNRWHLLSPEQIVDDSTHGLQCSGLVTLDIPEDIDGENTILPGGLYWLAVGSDNLEPAAVRLHSVLAGGLRAVWEKRDGVRSDPGVAIPPGSIVGPLSAVPGLGTIRQIGPSGGGRPAEDFERLVARASERLRHKNRAVTPWDYEHLVLERFPTVSKVKCFPNMDVASYPSPAPGSVLLVVVPRLPEPALEEWRPEVFSGLELEQIRDAMESVSSASARVSVVNPTYESVQVRCQVKLSGKAGGGQHLQDVNRALIDFIAPWNPSGRGGRFGWVIREKDVAALLHGLPFVEFVTDLSLLHISEDKDVPRSYYRRDTAQLFEETALAHVPPGALERRSVGSGAPWDQGPPHLDREVSARYPWSLAIPSSAHFVNALPKVEAVEPRITGVGELEIGRNFILEPGGE